VRSTAFPAGTQLGKGIEMEPTVYTVVLTTIKSCLDWHVKKR
jgi:hypothetical protein